MELFKTVAFDYEGESYDIRIMYNELVINVLAFKNGYPANGYRYQVKTPNDSDSKIILENWGVPELVEKCKDDITSSNWESMSNALNQAKIK